VKRQSAHEPLDTPEPTPEAAAPVTENASHAVLADDGAAPSGDATEAERWKAEFDAQQEAFKARSAEQREKAERERERWEKIRAEQGPAAPLPDAALPPPLRPAGAGTAGHVQGHGAWESVVGTVPADGPDAFRGTSPVPTDGRAGVTGESAGPPATHGTRAHAVSDSDHSGSELPSEMTSSFPSSAFDSGTPPSPAHRARQPLADERTRAARAPVPVPEPYASAIRAAADRKDGSDRTTLTAVTPQIFDGSLPPRTRVLVLLASLGINLLLPFVNGVMLGVGEIFAKEILGVWWSRPGGVAAKLGLGGPSKRFKRKD
jgi:hypothetical protein